jgi:hypothetical protein
LVQFGKFSEHIERIEIERGDDGMRCRIVLDEVHRVEVDGRMMGVLHVRVVVERVVRLVRVTSQAAVGAVLQVTLHLVVAVQVEKSEKDKKNCLIFSYVT